VLRNEDLDLAKWRDIVDPGASCCSSIVVARRGSLGLALVERASTRRPKVYVGTPEPRTMDEASSYYG